MNITDIWRDQPGDWFCISTKRRDGTWRDKFFARTEFDQVEDYIEANASRDVYACPHGFTHYERKKQYAVLPNLLWADLDEADPRHLEHKPTIAFRTSPGRYAALWVTDKPVTEELNKRMSYDCGADKSGWALTKVLRLNSGTRNYKYDAQPKVKLLWRDGPTYRVRDLERSLPPVEHSAIVHRALSKMFPRVTPDEGRRVARKYNLGMKYLGPCGDRSRAAFMLVMRIASLGGTAREAFAALLISRAYGHYDGSKLRAWQDVQNIFNKKQVA